MARQVKVDPAVFAAYAFTGRTIEYHRRQIRTALGFREATHGDRDKLTVWLAEQVCPSELNPDQQRQALLAKCRAERIEPPGRGSVDKILGGANRSADERFCATTVGRLGAPATQRLEELVAADKPTADQAGADEDDAELAGAFAELKADPGPLGLETLLTEIAKLGRVLALGLPADLFGDIAEGRVAAWRARAAAEYPSTLRRDHPRSVRLTLLAVLC